MKAMNEIGKTPRYINNPQWDTRQYTFSFIPLKEIYWHGELNDPKTMFLSGQKSHLYILSGVCLLLFLTGLLNFVNLYLVAMLRRGKEYGLKKVYGANKRNLFLQIWLENLLLTVSALSVAWLLIEVTQIPVNRLLNTTFSYTPFDGWLSVGVLLLLPLLTSVYPFFKYSFSSPIQSIQSIGWGNRSVRSRMVFLGIQYTLTFLITVCALYFNKQLDLMLNTDPGFRTKNIMHFRFIYESQDWNTLTDDKWEQNREISRAIRNKVKNCPYAEYTESVWDEITQPAYAVNFTTPDGNKALLSWRRVSPSFFKLFGIEMEEGILPENDGKIHYVMNRTAMKALQLTSLEGASVIEDDKYRKKKNVAFHPISAIAKDHYSGHLSMGTEPTIYEIDEFGSTSIYIAYQEDKLPELLDYLKGVMQEFYGTDTLEYTLLEDDVKAIYQEDRKIATIYNVFALIAIAVSCLGLFGISLFDIRQRYREIAIRKVNGADMKDLYQLLFKKYLTVLGASFVVAVPLAYYLIHQYTADFVVKAPISIGIFAIALVLVAIISMGTLYWQIHKAASIDPAKIMKTE